MIATFSDSPVFVAHLKAALRAVSEDTTRAHLCQLRIELAAGAARFIATNGHWLWVGETSYQEIAGRDERGKPVLGTSSAVVHIPRADVVTILKGIDKAKRFASVAVELDVDAAAVRQGAKTISFTRSPYSAVFPPYAQVLPAAVVKAADLIAFDPTYIADVASSFADVANDGNCGVLFQAAGGSEDPVVVTSDKSTSLAVIMPRRMRDGAPDASKLLERFRTEPKVA